MTAIDRFLAALVAGQPVAFPTELIGVGIAILAAIAASAAVLGFATVNIRERRRRRERLARTVTRRRQPLTAAADAIRLRRQEPDGSLDRVLSRLIPRPDLMRARLRQTGYGFTLGQFGFACGVVGLIGSATLMLAVGLAPLTALLGGVAAALILPNLVVTWLIGRRRTRFVENLAEGIDIMVRGLRAGLPVTETIRAVGVESPQPVGGVFHDVADRVRMGQDLEAAFVGASREIDTPELKFLSTTLSVQRETGGNLAETLANLADILRARRQMKLKVRAVSSEARASAMILGCLPFVMFAIIMLVNQDYAMELFTDPRGHLLLGAGLVSMVIGIFVMMRMVRFDI